MQPFKPLTGVFNGRLDRRLVPQNVLGVEASGFGIGPVLVLSVPVYIPLFALSVFVKGEIRGALGPKMNGFLLSMTAWNFLSCLGGLGRGSGGLEVEYHSPFES